MTASDAATMSEDERHATVKEIVCEILEIDPAVLNPSDHFREDHGADSLRAIEILAALERTLKITIDQADLGRMETLEGVNTVVAEAGGWA